MMEAFGVARRDSARRHIRQARIGFSGTIGRDRHLISADFELVSCSARPGECRDPDQRTQAWKAVLQQPSDPETYDRGPGIRRDERILVR